MGRVYGLPGDPGALSCVGRRVFSFQGAKIPFVQRVEFDDDADEGMATVRALAADAAGNALIDYPNDRACPVVFRTWVRVLRTSDPDPVPNLKAVMWTDEAGKPVERIDPWPEPVTVSEKPCG